MTKYLHTQCVLSSVFTVTSKFDEQPDKHHLWFKNYEDSVKSNPFIAKRSLSYVTIKGSLIHWIFYPFNEILLFMNSQKAVSIT